VPPPLKCRPGPTAPSPPPLATPLSRPDSRVYKPMSKECFLGKVTAQAKFKYIYIEQNWKYLYSVVITETGRKSNLQKNQWYSTLHRNIKLYSCESRQFFKWIFYLKQTNIITRAPLERRAWGNCPRCPPACELYYLILHVYSIKTEHLHGHDCRNSGHKIAKLEPWVSTEIFPAGGNVDILLPFSGCWRWMQIDVHKTVYPFYTTKKMLNVTATVIKMRFVGSQWPDILQ